VRRRLSYYFVGNLDYCSRNLVKFYAKAPINKKKKKTSLPGRKARAKPINIQKLIKNLLTLVLIEFF
jgi:hypothetical protein